MNFTEDERFPQSAWRQAVAEGKTIQGYWDWVKWQTELAEEKA